MRWIYIIRLTMHWSNFRPRLKYKSQNGVGRHLHITSYSPSGRLVVQIMFDRPCKNGRKINATGWVLILLRYQHPPPLIFCFVLNLRGFDPRSRIFAGTRIINSRRTMSPKQNTQCQDYENIQQRKFDRFLGRMREVNGAMQRYIDIYLIDKCVLTMKR